MSFSVLQKRMATEMTKQLESRFEGHALYHGGVKVFETLADQFSGIRVVRRQKVEVSDLPNFLIGTSGCCFGYLYSLTCHPGDSKGDGKNVVASPAYCKPDWVFATDLSISDLLPCEVNYERAGFPNNSAILVAGQACAGAGVRLMNRYYPVQRDVVSTNEFCDLLPEKAQCVPSLILERDKLLLVLNHAGYRPRPGMTRNPALPSCLVDSRNEEWYTTNDRIASLDITSRLESMGLDLQKTVAIAANWEQVTK